MMTGGVRIGMGARAHFGFDDFKNFGGIQPDPLFDRQADAAAVGTTLRFAGLTIDGGHQRKAGLQSLFLATQGGWS
jgi:hypothetical protein